MIESERNQTRALFFNAWRKHNAGIPIEDIEQQIVQVIRQHPEYHELLNDAEANQDRDFSAEIGIANPFLHMGMHLTIIDQISMDNPAGVRDCYRKLVHKYADEHRAQDNMIPYLSDWMITIQSASTPEQIEAAGSIYLDCIHRQLGSSITM